jgi:hypothetical protein
MEALSEEELGARLAYLQDQKALEKAAAESAKREMLINQEIEALRRQRQVRETLIPPAVKVANCNQEHGKRAVVDLTADSPQKVKSEMINSPVSETVHNDDVLEDIQFNDSPGYTPVRPGHNPLTDFTTAPPLGLPRSAITQLVESDVRAPPIAQSNKKRNSNDGITQKKQTDRERFSLVVPDAEYRCITMAPDGDDFIELRCKLCNGNCGLHSRTLIFFLGVEGFRTHIAVSHPSSLAPGDILTAREVVKRCLRRTLSEEEKQAVLNGDHDSFLVEKVLAGGADAGAPIHAPRPKRARRSRGENSNRTMQNVVVRSRSITAAVTDDTNHASDAEGSKPRNGVEEGESAVVVLPVHMTPGMTTRGSRIRKRKHRDAADTVLTARETSSKPEEMKP